MGVLPVSMAVVGAGAVGRRHIALTAASPAARLVAIVDPSGAAAALAGQHAVPSFRSLDDLLAAGLAEGIILATPTPLHLSHALACVAAGVPVLVEKPVTADLAEAEVLARAAAAAGVPVLVGHHRRHNPIIARARALLAEGRLGRIVAVHTTTWFRKPDDYFLPDWRRAPGAGPVLMNMIHDVDLLRHLLGEIAAVQAVTSNAQRGFAVEDTAVILLRFANGILGTMTVSDTATAPWSWELTSGENPDYPATGQTCTMITGTEGALELPGLRLWRQGPGVPGWFTPLLAEQATAPRGDDPLAVQIAHFAAVIRGQATPIITVADAARSLAVVDAIKRAAASGATETLHGV